MNVYLISIRRVHNKAKRLNFMAVRVAISAATGRIFMKSDI